VKTRIPESAIDGQSILPTLLGESQNWPTYQYWTWIGTAAQNATNGRNSQVYNPRVGKAVPGYSARVGNWKGVVHQCADSVNLKPSEGDEMELYNLSTDVQEKTNLASMHPDVVNSIKKLLISQNLSCECYQCP